MGGATIRPSPARLVVAPRALQHRRRGCVLDDSTDSRVLIIVEMKHLLVFTALAEGALGLALLIVPSLVARLLLGEELAGVAIPIARVAGIALIAFGIACRARHSVARHVVLQRRRHALSRLSWTRRRLEWNPVVAGGRLTPDPDSLAGPGIYERKVDENVAI